MTSTRPSAGQFTVSAQPTILDLHDVRPASSASSEDVAVFSCTVDGVPHVILSYASGESMLVPAACPHRPAGGPVLSQRAVVSRVSLVCLRHNNVYDLTSGRCVEPGGPGDPGVLRVRRGVRQGDQFLVDGADPEAA